MIAYALVSLLAIVVSLFIYSRNPRGKIQIYYLVSTYLIILWLSGVLLPLTPASLLELHFRSLFGIAAFMTLFLLLFICTLSEKRLPRLMIVAIVAINLVLSGLSFYTGLITENVTRIGEEVIPERGSLYLPSVLWVLAVACYGIYIIFVKLRDKRLAASQKRQLRVVILAITLAVITAATTNIVMPVITHSTVYNNFAPIALLLLSFGLGYAIFKHGLFDIRAAVARSVAYIASIGSLVLVYLFAVVVLTNSDVLSENLTVLQRFVFGLLAVLSGILFHPFKRQFDKLTSKVFYHEIYDSQAFIDRLNQTLVESTELDDLLSKCSMLISENFSVSKAIFFIKKREDQPEKIISTEGKRPNLEDLDKLVELTPRLKSAVFSTEQEAKGEAENAVKKILHRNNMEVLAVLQKTHHRKSDQIGYLFLGPKKNGSPLVEKDFKLLEITANELIIAIENVVRFDEIKQFNVTLQEEVDDATKQLRSTNVKLKALDETKDEFISMASHQLRTPLTSVKGYLSMVLEGDAGQLNEQQRKLLNQAFTSSQRMVYLISDLLNVSRLKTGKFVIESTVTDLPKIVEGELGQLQETAVARNLELSFVKPESDFPKLNLDETKIRQVIMNFVDNAIYYTPAGGKISVELAADQDKVEFKVIDTGLGVPKDEQRHLFSKFFRANNARRARPDGTGLGLFMAKKVVIAQGGAIIFKSLEGKGSTFGFSFPRSKLEVKETHKSEQKP